MYTFPPNHHLYSYVNSMRSPDPRTHMVTYGLPVSSYMFTINSFHPVNGPFLLCIMPAYDWATSVVGALTGLMLAPMFFGHSMFDHDDVIKWKHFPRYWPFVRGIHRWPVNYPHKGQLRGALMFSLICTWINGWVNNIETGDLRRHRPIMQSP